MSLKIFDDDNLTNRELAEELYKNSGVITPGEEFTFRQLKLVTLGGSVPAGEIQVRNTNYNDSMVENITPSAYASEDALYSNLEEIANYNPKNLRDWLDRK